MKPAARDIFALAFASLFPCLMSWLAFVVFSDDALEGSSLLSTVYSAGKILQFAFPLIYVAVFERRAFKTFSFAPRGIALAIAFSALANAGLVALYFGVLRGSPWLESTGDKIFGRVQEFHLATPAGYFALAAFLSVLHSLLEEYYWRWFVFGWMRLYMPVGVAIVLSSIGFMLHHVIILAIFLPDHFWTLALPLSLCVAFGGGVWAWLYQRTGSLLGPWISHILIDAGIMAVGFDLMRDRFV